MTITADLDKKANLCGIGFSYIAGWRGARVGGTREKRRFTRTFTFLSNLSTATQTTDRLEK